MINAIHLSIYKVKTCVSSASSNTEKFCRGLWTKSFQSFPSESLGSSSLSSSSSNWHDHLLLGHPTSLFPSHFNSNTLLGIKPAHDDCRLSAVMIRVTAIGTKVRGFKPGRGDGFLRAMKISSIPSFGEEVMLEATGHKISWHVKYHLQV
jgi:hypothetical protein